MPDYSSKEELYGTLDKTLAILQADEAFKQRIARANLSMGFVVTDLNAEYAINLLQGTVSGTAGSTEGTTFAVTLNSATLDKLLSGRLDGESAYMSGALRLRGQEWQAESALAYMSPITKAYRAATSN